MAEKFISLAQSLGLDPLPSESPSPRLEDITDSHAFALAVVSSPEFRRYIIDGLLLGQLAPAIICRLMDYAWGKPPERVEHTGKDGKPIETVTTVRRIIVRVEDHPLDEPSELPEPPPSVH